jgi:hypothetical protein
MMARTLLRDSKVGVGTWFYIYTAKKRWPIDMGGKVLLARLTLSSSFVTLNLSRAQASN